MSHNIADQLEIFRTAAERMKTPFVLNAGFTTDEELVDAYRKSFIRMSQAKRQDHDVRIARKALKDASYAIIYGTH